MSVQNVTEVVRKRQALEKLPEIAEEAKKIKSDFLSNISHELRTPLNGILGFTDLAKDCERADVRSQYLELVSTSASKLLNIVNNVLDFSNLDSGSFNLEVRQVHLCELVRQIVDVASSSVHQKGLEMLV